MPYAWSNNIKVSSRFIVLHAYTITLMLFKANFQLNIVIISLNPTP